MKLDYKLKVIMAEVKQEMKDEHDLSISEHEIAAIVGSQFSAAEYAFSKGLDVKIHKMVRFRRKFKKVKSVVLRDLILLKPLIPYKEYLEMVRFYKEQFEDWIKRVERSKRNITVKELIEADEITTNQGRYFGKERPVKQEETTTEYEYL